jgi:hypothetical protein
MVGCRSKNLTACETERSRTKMLGLFKSRCITGGEVLWRNAHALAAMRMYVITVGRGCVGSGCSL